MKCISGNLRSTLIRLTSFINEKGITLSESKGIYQNAHSYADLNHTILLLKIIFPSAQIKWVPLPAFLDEDDQQAVCKTRIYSETTFIEQIPYFRSIKKLYIYSCQVIFLFNKGISLGIRGVFKT